MTCKKKINDSPSVHIKQWGLSREKGKCQAEQVLPYERGPLQGPAWGSGAPAVEAWLLLVHDLVSPLHALSGTSATLGPPGLAFGSRVVSKLISYFSNCMVHLLQSSIRDQEDTPTQRSD